jgi:hypothetical protein
MIKNMWPTPVYFGKTSVDKTYELAQYLLQDYEMNSQKNVFDLDSPILNEFKENVVLPAFNNYLRNTLNKSIDDWGGHKLQGWVMSYSNDTSLDYHNHRGSQVSGVFYLLCDDSTASGSITFTDPRQNANRGYDLSFKEWFEPYRTIPKSGEIVIFPSFLYHSVSTYRSNIRIALPVDLFLFNNS